MAIITKTLEERVAELEAYLPMLARLMAWEQFHGVSIPEQLHRTQQSAVAAAEALMSLEPSGTLSVNWSGPEPVNPVFVASEERSENVTELLGFAEAVTTMGTRTIEAWELEAIGRSMALPGAEVERRAREVLDRRPD